MGSIGCIGGAVKLLLAKVKNASGRIGIFLLHYIPEVKISVSWYLFYNGLLELYGLHYSKSSLSHCHTKRRMDVSCFFSL